MRERFLPETRQMQLTQNPRRSTGERSRIKNESHSFSSQPSLLCLVSQSRADPVAG